MKINPTRRDVYVGDRPLTKAEEDANRAGPVRYFTGHRPGPAMEDAEIEKEEHRREQIPSGDGKVCVSILPGTERLGEVYVNVQFEAHPGERELCHAGQNLFLLTEADWMRGFIEQLSRGTEAVWDVALVGQACPKAEKPIQIEAAVERLVGTRVATQAAAGVERTVTNQAGSPRPS